MEHILISIIVPVYNVEQYLEKCVKSIQNQTYKNIEIILIDDGSTDNSGTICDNIAKSDERIKVVHKKNEGLSATRNYGIKLARGEYIGFVDSDDYIDDDMYEILVNLCEFNNADISMVAYKKIKGNKIIEVSADDGAIEKYDKIEGLKKILLNTDIENHACNKLFRRYIFDKILFPVGKKFEDIYAMAKFFEQANKIIYKKEAKYNYLQRNNSIVNTYTYENLRDYVTATEYRYNYFINKYKELDEYNEIAFIYNMIIVYKIGVVKEINGLLDDFEKNFELFIKLVRKNENKLFSLIDDYKRVILSIILWDRKFGSNIVKEFEKEKENKKLKNAVDI